MPELYHFEDFAAGQVFVSHEHAMGQEEMIAFARAFDPQPMHTDEAVATKLFGGIIASGWHTAALTMRLLVDGAMPKVAGGALGLGVEKMSWPQPVRPGDVLRATITVLGTRPSRSRPDRGIVSLHTRTCNQAGETVLDHTSAILVPRRA